MLRHTLTRFALRSILVGASSASFAAVTVTQPTASTVIEAGDDYATQVLGNAWDMNDAVDIDTEESLSVSAQGFSAGIFSGTATVQADNIYPLHMGQASSINLSRGATHPIDTSHYRYVTYKLRVNPTTQAQYTRVIGILDGGSYAAMPKPTVVESNYAAPLLNNTWQILSFDMVTNNDGLYYQWLDFPQLTGLRLDPANTNAGSPWISRTFNIDWIRLTAPATAAQKTLVQWSDTGTASTYSIIAVDGAGTSYALAGSVSGTSYQADTSVLAPGQYQIQVKRNADSIVGNSATFRINSPPQITLSAPSASGEVTKDFATAIVGNAWGPFTAADFQTINNFTNVSYVNPVGSFYGRPTNFDPGWYLNLGGHTIDTSLYRSLCFDLEVFGPRSIGLGSVARVFWGNSAAAVTTSDDIVLDDNVGDTVVSKYCIPDLAVASLEAGVPVNGGTWSGTKSVFRIDPDEFTPPGGCVTPDTCHDVRLDKVTLSPFAQANPGYTFQWALADTDNASDTIALYLDPDTNSSNGNEIFLHTALTATGSGSYAWPGSASVNYGTYNVLFVVDDGINSVAQYAGGPLIVGAYDGIFRNGFDVP